MKRRSLIGNKIGNKKAEFTPAAFFAMIVILIIIAPIILKVINSATRGVIDAVNDTAPAAALEGEKAVEKVTNLFDYVVIIGMLVTIVLLFISSFFIDAHPVFIVIYIVAAFVLVLIAPNVLDAVDTLWGHFPTESGQLPFTDFMRQHLVGFLVGIMVVTGIIIYAKFKSNQNEW
jgi:tetrahydromethanopterin S-methyltransferase subunit B